MTANAAPQKTEPPNIPAGVTAAAWDAMVRARMDGGMTRRQAERCARGDLARYAARRR